MIKVAFFAEILIKEFDGASRTMFQLLERIPTDKFEFLFICGMHQENMPHNFKVVEVPTLQVPGNATYRFALPSLKSAAIKKKIDAFKPDVVHIATPSFLGNFGLNYAMQRNLPVISIYHTHFISYMDYYLKNIPFLINPAKKVIQNTYNKFYNRCQLVYIPSESIAHELTHGGVKTQVQKIWKRGIDLSLFSPNKKDAAYLESIVGNSRKTILFSSRLVWEKNLQILIDLYPKIQEAQYNLVIAGSGVAEQACREKMPKAHFLGHVEHLELAKLYASADVFIFPSVTETFGNVVLEAMASGLPCVIANGGGSKDFITHGQNGFLCSPYQAEDYWKNIQTLLNRPEIAQQFSENGLRYSQQFDWEYLAKVYFNDIQNLA